MRTGRPPKPTALHKLHNTERKSTRERRAKEPKPVGDLKDAPDWMTESQQEGWRYAIRNCPPGLLYRIDRGVLAVWVEAEDRHRIATVAMAEQNRRRPRSPFLVKGAVSPYVLVIEKAARIMLRAAEALGFSPVARPRLKVGPYADDPQLPAPEKNPWAKFTVVPGGKNRR